MKMINKSNGIIASDSVIRIQAMDTSMFYDVWRNSLDENNRRFVPDEVFETLEEASEVVEQIIKFYDSETGPFIYALMRQEDNANMGYVQLIKIEDGWEIGYHIAKIYTCKGYATRAVNLFLDYIKKETKLNEVLGIVLSDNHASIKVLEKTGFELKFDGIGVYQGKKRKIRKYIKCLTFN